MLRILSACAATVLAVGCGQSSQDTNALNTAAITDTAGSQTVATPPSGASSTVKVLSGTLRQNSYLKLMATEAGFVDPPDRKAPAGQRYFAIGLRGTSRSRNDVAIEIGKFVYAQDERGCISKPEINTPWLKKPFGEAAVFTQSQMTDGQLTFPVPEDSKQIRVLIASADGQGLAIPAGRDFSPSWPNPVRIIDDGSTMRVMVLPRPEPPPVLPPSADGQQHVVLDFAVENLSSTQGIEFQTSQQLRLKGPNGSFIQASALTNQLGCRLEDGDIIPPGHVRRFMVVYEVPIDTPLMLQYRGFELEETDVDLP